MSHDNKEIGVPTTRGVVFDGDDTLWLTEALYDAARSEVAAVVAEQGLDAIVWEQLERRIDVENVATLGFSRARFPTSCMQAYHQVCRMAGRAPDSAVEARVRRTADSVFDRRPALHPSARSLLTFLRSRGVRRALLTKGDREVQQKRIQQSGLADLFDHVSIVDDKTPESVTDAVAVLGTDADATWMVGNSERSDILPALRAGLRAIHVDAHVWEHERVGEPIQDSRIQRAASLADVAALLDR